MNFGMGLTKVRFRDYFSGTALGIIVGTFIFTFFVGTVRDVWAGGRWEELLSGKVSFSIALSIFSFSSQNCGEWSICRKNKSSQMMILITLSSRAQAIFAIFLDARP